MVLLLTSLLISLIASLGVWVMGRKDPCGRPWLTALCLGILLTLPVLSVLPKFQLEILRPEQISSSEASSFMMFRVLGIGWFLVTALLVLRLVWNHFRLQRWLADTEEAYCHELLHECAVMLKLSKIPEIRLKRGLTTPVVSGIWKPVIILPITSTEWSRETQKMAILHELAHVQRRDLWIRFAAEFASVLHWYNPLVWWLRAKMLSQCEYACDALVVSVGADRGRYINALCDVVESALYEAKPSGVLAMADHAPLKLRVDRLLGSHRVEKSWGAIAVAVMATSTALGLSLVKPAAVSEVWSLDESEYNQEEIDLRNSANPFPSE